MRARSKIVLMAFFVPFCGLAGGLTGTILDPQHLAVPNATITLNCSGKAKFARSDTQGRFGFSDADWAEDCSISVTCPGFAPVYERLVGREPRDLSIRLALAPVRESVTVMALLEDPSALLRTSLTSVSLSDDELKRISNNTADLIRYAKERAGATVGQTVVYVDGLPGGELPPSDRVARITVNANPFSAEYADGDITAINVTTKGPGRQVRLSFGGASLGVGGRDTLIPNLQSKSRNEGGGMTGPIPYLPFTFSAHFSIGSNQADVPLPTVIPSTAQASRQTNARFASVENHSKVGSLDLYYSGGESLGAHLAYYESRSNGSNLGVGGLTLPEAGFRSSLTIREARATTSTRGDRFEYRGGFVMTQMSSDTHANSEGPGVSVLGGFVAGGAPFTRGTSVRSTWTLKNVVESTPGPPSWSAGMTVSRSSDFKQDIPNPAGSFTFETDQAYADALAGAPTGTWFVTRGNGTLHHATLTAAPFVHKEVVRLPHLLVTGGLRADYQAGLGTLLSPRLAGAAQWWSFVFRASAGLFARDIGNNVLVRVLETDGSRLQEFMASGVPIFGTFTTPVENQSSIRTRFAPDLTRPRQLMEKASVERRLGQFTLNIEYTSTRDRHLLGSRRLADGSGWLDLLESNRSAERHRLHPQVRYKWGRHSAAIHYEWVHSHDDTDGPFSFPARQENIRADWARSAGIPAHSITLTDSFQLPGAVSVTLTDSLRGSAPFNITTGLDSANDGLYTDRGGLARNSGNGPGYNSLELYASKRIALPNPSPKTHKKIYVNLGAQGDNLLGNRNFTGFGSVVGSPTFGRPLGTLPGRSLRFWLNLD